jgi:predicted metal-binding membrane protein
MGSSAADPTSRLLRHERLIVASGVALLVALSWWFLATGAGMGGGGMGEGMAMAPPPLGAVVLMWWLMMFAMMLPAAAPTILLYGRVRHMRGSDAAIAQTWIFLVGYLAIWLLFAVAAAAGQQMLSGGAMMLADERLATGVLIAAGAYQLSPLKSACLRQCRTPAQFLSRHWRPGTIGALRLGALHGAYCVGCCWLLMTLLFVGGIMNFAWIAALTLIVGVEKLLPGGEWLGRIAGVALIAWGAARLLA